MNKRIISGIIGIIILIAAFGVDIPLDNLRRSYVYPEITYRITDTLNFFGLGIVLAGIAMLIFIFGLLTDSDKTIRITHQLLLSLVISGIIILFFKLIVGRVRPDCPGRGAFVLFPGFHSEDQSFPSGHTTAAFGFATIFAAFSPYLGGVAYLLAILVGIARIHSSAHFLSDVLVGALLGYLVSKYILAKMNTAKPSGLFRIPIAEKTIIIYSILTILIFSSYFFFYNLQSPGLFDLDEAVYAESTREMVESGNWITPHMNYELRFDKPILIYWLMAIAYKLFGITEFAARFWSALNGILIALWLFYFGRKWKSVKFGLLSSLIFITCLEPIIIAHAAITDMTLLLFLTLSLLGFYLGYLKSQVPSSKFQISSNPPQADQIPNNSNSSPSVLVIGSWNLFGTWNLGFGVFYIGIALATLTKGLIGIILPGAIVLLFLLATGQFRRVIKDMKFIPGILVFLLITLPWYILVIRENGWIFIQQFFLFHHLHRFTGEISGHSGNIFYYVLVILIGFFPWSSFLVSGIKTIIPWNWRTWRNLSRQDQFPLFGLIWIIIIFIFFTAAKTKLPNYIAPLFPPITFLVAAWWQQLINQKSETRSQKSEIMLPTILLLSLGLIIAGAFFILPLVLKPVAASGKLVGVDSIKLGFVPYLVAIPILIGIISASISFYRKRYAVGITILICMMLVFWQITVTYLVPIVYEYQQGPLYRYATALRYEWPSEDIVIIEYGFNYPSVIFYSRRPILRLGENDFDRIKELFQSEKKVYLLANPKRLNQLQQLPKFNLIIIEGQYLFSNNFGNENKKSSI
ncbi:MAG: phosphatase PAP2 family protein [bacterium]